MLKILIACPGQGSQKLGMGKEMADAYPTARLVFEEVSDTLGIDLIGIMWGDNQQELNDTSNAQVAIMAVSVAIARVLLETLGRPIDSFVSAVAGHSLGEYSALCISGSLSLSETAKILRQRGQEMMKAALRYPGGMAAILGSNIDTVREIVSLATKATNNGILVVANDNSNNQVVISGSTGAIASAKEISSSHGVRRFIELPVSGAFHSPLMQEAQDAMAEPIKNLKISAPAVPLVSSSTTVVYTDPEEIRLSLSNQITGSVRWREVVDLCSHQGFNTVLEVGNGGVLCGLVGQTSASMNCFGTDSPEKLEQVVKMLS